MKAIFEFFVILKTRLPRGLETKRIFTVHSSPVVFTWTAHPILQGTPGQFPALPVIQNL